MARATQVNQARQGRLKPARISRNRRPETLRGRLKENAIVACGRDSTSRAASEVQKPRTRRQTGSEQRRRAAHARDLLNQVLQPQFAKYDAREWYWLGNLAASRNMLALWSTAPAQTITTRMSIIQLWS